MEVYCNVWKCIGMYGSVLECMEVMVLYTSVYMRIRACKIKTVTINYIPSLNVQNHYISKNNNNTFMPLMKSKTWTQRNGRRTRVHERTKLEITGDHGLANNVNPKMQIKENDWSDKPCKVDCHWLNDGHCLNLIDVYS